MSILINPYQFSFGYPTYALIYFPNRKKEIIEQSLHKKMKFSIRNLFCKCDQIRRKLRTYAHLLKKSLIQTSFFAYRMVKFRISRLKHHQEFDVLGWQIPKPLQWFVNVSYLFLYQNVNLFCSF